VSVFSAATVYSAVRGLRVLLFSHSPSAFHFYVCNSGFFGFLLAWCAEYVSSVGSLLSRAYAPKFATRGIIHIRTRGSNSHSQFRIAVHARNSHAHSRIAIRISQLANSQLAIRNSHSQFTIRFRSSQLAFATRIRNRNSHWYVVFRSKVFHMVLDVV
jgi:hypothetical protein